jgi:tRNA modification GTPase
MFDLSKELDAEDLKILDFIKDKKKIIIANKSDLEGFNLDRLKEKYDIKAEDIIEMSTKEEKGIDDLKQKLVQMFNINAIEQNDENILTNERHKEAVDSTIASLKNIQDSLKANLPLDMISIDLQNAIKYLGEITGESVSEEIINGIFKKFCLGK